MDIEGLNLFCPSQVMLLKCRDIRIFFGHLYCIIKINLVLYSAL